MLHFTESINGKLFEADMVDLSQALLVMLDVYETTLKARFLSNGHISTCLEPRWSWLIHPDGTLLAIFKFQQWHLT